jgi:hypothetical protein
MTVIGKIIHQRSIMNQNDFDTWILENLDNLFEEEKQMLTDAMMYAFDEDGHTGTWKYDVINKYYDKIK